MFDYLGLGESLLESVEGFDSEYTAEDDAMMEAVESIPCTDDPDDAFVRASLENVENFYAIANAITVDEFATYVATNEEVVYEEGRIKKVFGTIKQWILKAWAKIKGIFDACLDAINSKLRSDKAFVEKYGKKVKAAGSYTIKKGYAISWGEARDTSLINGLASSFAKYVNGPYTKVIDKVDAAVSGDGKITKTGDASFKPEVIMGKIRGDVFGKASLTDEEFNNALNEKFNPKKTADVKVTGAEVIQEISEAKVAKAAIKEAYNATKRYFNMLTKEADGMEKLAVAATSKKDAKEANVMSIVGKWNSCCKSCITLAHRIEQKQIGAINKLHSQARAAAVKMASGGETKPANESASMLDNLELI